ncbi:MAG: hypothetical protein HW420_1506 [Candidatus Nitrosotenuis sp.]|nr:hypothetical protein [Candidatus Nitrosotenuis sp.]
MLRKILLISLVVIGLAILVSPSSFDFIGNIPNEGKKITLELTDPAKDTADTWQNNIQKAFAFVGEKIEGLAFSADVFLSKQENDNKTSKQEEGGFFGKINGQKTAEPKTPPTGTLGGGGSQENNNNENNNPASVPASVPVIIQNPTTQPITSKIPFDTLSLITKKQSDNRVSMEYDDTSGKTMSVTVQIRNEEQILFTGQYFSSSSETTIMDFSATSHFIDLVVEHAVYGQVTATAFIPAGNNESVIYGVFSKN